MSLPATDGSYRAVAAALTPTDVSQFFEVSYQWELEQRVDHVQEIWVRPPSDDIPKARIMLPLATDYADYEQRFEDALRAIALINHWDADEVQRHIISTNADLFLVHLNQIRGDDTIPLRQAEVTVDAISEMVKAAAITAATPNRSQRGGRLPNVVSTFLEEDVRLGHTKPGSFVFTVITRLNDSADSGETDSLPMFPRTVMETLARGLETARDLAQGTTSVSIDDAAQSGLSAGLVESLEDLGSQEDLRSLELSFEWATTKPRPPVGAEPIRLQRSELQELAGVRELLLRREEPPRRATLFGMVKELAREDGILESDDVGSAIISAEVNGRRRNVHVTLSGEDHLRAIEAYQRRRPLIVTGDLVFERRAWRLVGDIEVDPRLIERGRPSS
jgi:hypothetical protein